MVFFIALKNNNLHPTLFIKQSMPKPMKSFLFILFVIFYSSIASQVNIKEINKSLAKVNDTLYASKYEVMHKLYREFLKELKQSNNNELLKKAQVDSTKWRIEHYYGEPMVIHYHAHPAYNEYLIVNVSYEGATLFCNWLSDIYNQNPKRKYKKATFRLPTEAEWIAAAQAGDANANYAWKGDDLKNNRGDWMCNIKRAKNDSMGVAGINNDYADVTAPSQSYWPNAFGIYNMCGNVAEMVSEKGITKGGSWKHEAEYLNINSTIPFDGSPQVFVGFRYFAEIIEK